jgi:homoserine dehydrogenase
MILNVVQEENMRLLIIGFGTVGQGLAELIVEKEKELQQKHDLQIQVTGIADKLKGSILYPEGIDLKNALERVRSGEMLGDGAGRPFDGDALAMIEQADADIMVEATYTDIQSGEPAASHVRTALSKGMHVVTTNKGPVALHYHELAGLALDMKVQLLFEGTVMSGTPVLNLQNDCLAGSRIQEIKGILNGTTNYILTRMEEGLSYDKALEKAQELGYAEAVPDADVKGWDALAKVTILAKVVMDARANPFDYSCEGITGISVRDIKDALQRNRRYKLIGRVWREGSRAMASVAPEEVEMSHPLAGVMGAANALTITTDTLGDVTVVGPGAGRRETGYSLLVDLIKIADSVKRNSVKSKK